MKASGQGAAADIGSRLEFMVDDYLIERCSGGEMITKPLIFDGDRLSLNVSTSAAGSARIEFQYASGEPLEGFTLEDCHEIIGDTLDYTVAWKDGPNVRGLAGRPVRLRIAMNDADLYGFRFVGN